MNTKECKKTIANVMKAVDSSDLVEGADCLFFSDGWVSAFSGDIYITSNIDIEDEFIVKADDFYKALSRITSADFNLKKLGKGSIRISGGRVKAEIALAEVSEELDMPEVPEDGWEELPDNFVEGLKLCAISTSNDYSNALLCNVFVQGGFMYSTDDRRISRFKLSDEMESFLLPSKAALELAKMEVDEYCVTDEGVFFANDDLVFFSVLNEGEMPEMDKFLEVEGTEIKLPKKELKQAVETAATFSDADFDIDRRIEVSLDGKKLVCKGSKDNAWASHTIKYKYSGEPFSFSIHPTFFLQILDVSDKMIIGDKVALFSIDNFDHVVAL